MFAVETLPPQYYEERAAAEAAKRLAEQQRAAAVEAQSRAPIATQQAAPASLQHALYQTPPLSRPGSSTVLGSIFQNFMKRTPSPSGITPAATPPRVDTPTSNEEQTRRDARELIAKLRRDEEMTKDTDICALPGWR